MEKEEKVEKTTKKTSIAKSTPKLKKEFYVLDMQVAVGDKLYEKGDKIELTLEGYKFFKQNKYIK